jgi:hypothetical protein
LRSEFIEIRRFHTVENLGKYALRQSVGLDFETACGFLNSP